MTFAREKRLLLGWLALLAPLPLPFNEVLEWPVLFLFLLVVIHFLGRAEDPTHTWLDNRALNGLGLLYLPVLAFDIWRGAQSGQMVTALLHLILFVLLVKLYSVRQEKEKWHVLFAIFFVFVASMATSSNIAIALYLLAVLALGLLALARLSELHMRAALGLAGGLADGLAGSPGGGAREREDGAAAAARLGGLPRPGRGALLAILAVALLAAPIFAALPRLAQPFLTGRGAGNLGMSRVSGFSDEVSLDFSGRIRTSTQIAMRLELEQPGLRPEDLRFKGAAYDFYRNNRWLRDNDLFDERRPEAGLYRLDEAPESGSATIYLEPIDSGSLLVPSEAVSLSFVEGPKVLYIDGGGGLVLPLDGRRRRETLEYRVGLAAAPQVNGRLEGFPPQAGPAALDTAAVTPRMAELARQVMGEGSAEEKILRLESHLISSYSYTVEISDEGGDKIEDFLFVKKAGHCEYFATAMVLLLRSEGIPARFATGFLGAETNSIEDLLVVRQSNAHAWVEAYSPERGWQVYDPTPPAGRPGQLQVGMGLWVRQLYEYIAFRWDRYVLTYGADDQGGLRERLQKLFAGAFERVKSWFGAEEAPVPPPEVAGPDAGEIPAEATGAATRGGLGALSAGLVAVVLIAAGLLLWRRRPRSATASYLALRRVLVAAEEGVSAATPPLEVLAAMRRLAPAEAAAGSRLIGLYLGEAFAGRPLSPEELKELPALRGSLEKALRRSLAQQRAARRAGGARLAEQVDT